MRMIRKLVAARPASSSTPVLLDPVQTRVDFGQRLWAAGLGRHADQLVGAGRDAVRLLTGLGGGRRGGGSFLGGHPELPDDVAWPVFRGRPQHFLAQVDLAEVQGVYPESPLPEAGRLLFFRHADPDWWSEHHVHSVESAAIVYVEPGRSVRSRPSPSGGSFRFQPVVLHREVAFPSDIAEQVELVAEGEGRFDDVDQGQLDALLHDADSLATHVGAAPMHRLLGHASPIQHEPVGPGCSLLAQIDSDASTGMMWGDAGIIYWWLRDDDLAAGRWHRAIWEEQCC
jgi:uncharacterized protein YwqG